MIYATTLPTCILGKFENRSALRKHQIYTRDMNIELFHREGCRQEEDLLLAEEADLSLVRDGALLLVQQENVLLAQKHLLTQEEKLFLA